MSGARRGWRPRRVRPYVSPDERVALTFARRWFVAGAACVDRCGGVLAVRPLGYRTASGALLERLSLVCGACGRRHGAVDQ